jgi:hypothetical protein
VIDESTTEQLNPAVAYNPVSGEYLAVWEHQWTAGSSDYDIHARRISASGAPLPGAIVISLSLPITRSGPTPLWEP